jgi:hypothetical protein
MHQAITFTSKRSSAFHMHQANVHQHSTCIKQSHSQANVHQHPTLHRITSRRPMLTSKWQGHRTMHSPRLTIKRRNCTTTHSHSFHAKQSNATGEKAFTALMPPSWQSTAIGTNRCTATGDKPK